MRRSLLALAAVGLGVAGVSVVILGSGGSGGAATAATTDAAPATAEVTRRNLVLVDDVDGTLGYADARTLAASAPGTVTRLPAEGTVVTRGRSLYDVNAAGVRLLYGSMPLWRRLGVGVADGADVEQLERNLVELGHDPGGMTVDEDVRRRHGQRGRVVAGRDRRARDGSGRARRRSVPAGAAPRRPARRVRRARSCSRGWRC